LTRTLGFDPLDERQYTISWNWPIFSAVRIDPRKNGSDDKSTWFLNDSQFRRRSGFARRS
jgi:hypothetical protein